MIDFEANIISGKSIANVSLGENISTYLAEIHANHKLDYFEYYLPNKEKKLTYIIDKTITLTTLTDGTITSIGCNENYKGKYNGSLHTGQTMEVIIKLTEIQRIFHGCIIVNDDFGFSYELPAPYDEIADKIIDIPSDLILNNIWVADFSEWITWK